MSITSADAISAPPRVQIDPDGRFGDDVERERGVDVRVVEQALVDHVARAVEALFAGLEHEADGARAARARRATSRRAAPTSIATCASCPHACIVPSTSLAYSSAGVFRHRQRVHVGAQQDRRAGLATPCRSATTDETTLPVCTSRPRPVERVEDVPPACAAARARARDRRGCAAAGRPRRAARLAAASRSCCIAGHLRPGAEPLTDGAHRTRAGTRRRPSRSASPGQGAGQSAAGSSGSARTCASAAAPATNACARSASRRRCQRRPSRRVERGVQRRRAAPPTRRDRTARSRARPHPRSGRAVHHSHCASATSHASSGPDARGRLSGRTQHAFAQLRRSAAAASRRAARPGRPRRARGADDGAHAPRAVPSPASRVEAPVLRALAGPDRPGELVDAVVARRARRARPCGSARRGPCPRRSRTRRTTAPGGRRRAAAGACRAAGSRSPTGP